jgi:intraflagellar transport protein 74
MTRGASIPNQMAGMNPARADDRPMTRGGLGGLQTSAGGFNRTVQDKTYYLGILRAKISEINNELFRMNKEITNMTSDNSNYLSYGRK